jgi:hypothetical protein
MLLHQEMLQKALEGLNAAEISITVFLQLTNQVEVIKVQENLEH